MQLTKLSDGFGIEARGTAFSRPYRFEEVRSAFFKGQVLVIRSQNLTPRRFLDFARRLGPPEPHVIDQFHHPEHAEILILSNVKRNGEPVGLADAGTYFHTDYSYLEVPARATLLYSIEGPKKGGDTWFADQDAAYEGLSSSLKAKIDGLVALHHYGNRADDRRTVGRMAEREGGNSGGV